MLSHSGPVSLFIVARESQFLVWVCMCVCTSESTCVCVWCGLMSSFSCASGQHLYSSFSCKTHQDSIAPPAWNLNDSCHLMSNLPHCSLETTLFMCVDLFLASSPLLAFVFDFLTTLHDVILSVILRWTLLLFCVIGWFLSSITGYGIL